MRKAVLLGLALDLLLALALALDLTGAAGLLHPRDCPACGKAYHRGRRCEWEASSG